jgi:hypothetical protein
MHSARAAIGVAYAVARLVAFHVAPITGAGLHVLQVASFVAVGNRHWPPNKAYSPSGGSGASWNQWSLGRRRVTFVVELNRFAYEPL